MRLAAPHAGALFETLYAARDYARLLRFRALYVSSLSALQLASIAKHNDKAFAYAKQLQALGAQVIRS